MQVYGIDLSKGKFDVSYLVDNNEKKVVIPNNVITSYSIHYTKLYEYIRYDVVGIEENLLDLNKDPFETKHFTNDPTHAERLDILRKVFDEEWFPLKN